jgi:hypothetical protein
MSQFSSFQFFSSFNGGHVMDNIVGVIIPLAIVVVMIVAMWRVFEKAGQPGWGCLIPFYNIYLLLQIAGRPGWWLILFCIPLVNLVVGIIVYIDIAASFGKDVLFGIGLLFLGFIFFPILAFGDAEYIGPQAK